LSKEDYLKGVSVIKLKYIIAYDPIVKQRVPYVIINDVAISLITKYKFNYLKEKIINVVSKIFKKIFKNNGGAE